MPTTLETLRAAFVTAVESEYHTDVDPLLVPTANEKFGDYQSNVAMALARPLKAKPRDVAERVKATAERLLAGVADRLEIAGPGFINVYLSPAWLAGQATALLGDVRLGVPKVESPRRVVVDYPSLNVAKESHIGHLRPSAIGDAIARILAFRGDAIIRQNHIGDWGTAFGMLLTYIEQTGGGDESLVDIEKLYKSAKARFDHDEAFKTASRHAVVRLQAGEPAERERWQHVIDLSRKHLDEVFGLLGLLVTRDDERGESFYNPHLSSTVDELLRLGVAEHSEGAVVVWVKPFNTPLIVRKSDGGYGYAATDLTALRYRTAELRAQRLVYCADVRQKQHFQQFSDAARRAGWLGETQFEHVMFGTILGEDNKPYKTKSGESVKLLDVLREAIGRARTIVDAKNADLPDTARAAVAKAVGIGAIKYFDLSRDRLTDYVFDWENIMSMEGNTAPYLQYAYARVRAIFRKAGADAQTASAAPGGGAASAVPPLALESPEELRLLKHVLRFGEVIDDVARDLKPHVLCAYLYDLATLFSGFYEHCPVLKSEGATRATRLALCDLTARTLALGLDLLGIEHPEQL
ncbi:MAG TPA: arginine--tRNA ligase [Tepidisphaeraceae bacterium]|jgi:arginyl-tRNA synthetase